MLKGCLKLAGSFIKPENMRNRICPIYSGERGRIKTNHLEKLPWKINSKKYLKNDFDYTFEIKVVNFIDQNGRVRKITEKFHKNNKMTSVHKIDQVVYLRARIIRKLPINEIHRPMQRTGYLLSLETAREY